MIEVSKGTLENSRISEKILGILEVEQGSLKKSEKILEVSK